MSASRGLVSQQNSHPCPRHSKSQHQHRGSATCQAKRFSHLASSYSRQE